jgi:hypothetical protein
METVVGACGLVCSDCDARAATLASDREGIEKVAEKWRKVHSPEITAASVWCNGCMSAGGPKCAHVPMCAVRKCVVERGLSSCADCEDYACEKLAGFLKMAPRAKTILDALRAAREAQG